MGRHYFPYAQLPFWPPVTRYGKWESGQQYGPSHWSSHSPRKAICSNVKTIGPSALSVIQAKSCWRSYLSNCSHKQNGVIAEEQAGFQAGRSTTEQIFNLRIICERYLQHQQDLYYVIVVFKKAFDRVGYAALWATMNLCNINGNLIKLIQNLYNKVTSAVYLNNSIGNWFRTMEWDKVACSRQPSSTYS